jgi:Na+/H+-dicarboxylate symporter
LSQAPSLARWIVELLPANVFKAASDGAMLPLILFAVLLGLALTRVSGAPGVAVLHVFKGISEAMLVLVAWVLRFAPIGVFALAIPLAARMGLAAAGALIYYIALLSLVSAAFIAIVLYPATVIIGRVPLARFARAAAPAQAVAFTSRSSLAALPATFEGAREGLGLPEEIVSFFLPLAASMFRVGAAMAQVVGVLFIARLYNVPLEASQLATIVVTVVLTTFSVPGVPAGAIIVMAPVLYAANVPVEGLGVLLGVDTIPDMFRTMANVTGWLGCGSILARFAGSEPAVQQA